VRRAVPQSVSTVCQTATGAFVADAGRDSWIIPIRSSPLELPCGLGLFPSEVSNGKSILAVELSVTPGEIEGCLDRSSIDRRRHSVFDDPFGR
jgi:hypothetical protein